MNQSWIYLRRKSRDSTETVTNYSFSDIYLRILKHIFISVFAHKDTNSFKSTKQVDTSSCIKNCIQMSNYQVLRDNCLILQIKIINFSTI